MTPAAPAGDPTRRRRDDSTWFRVLDRFGLPTLLTLLLFWAWQGAIREERAAQGVERARLIQVVDRLTVAIETNTEAGRTTAAELAQLSERVRALETMGERAMSRAASAHHHP